MTNINQPAFNAVISFLHGSKLDELLSLFIEAKTGSYGNEDRLPPSYFLMIDDLEVMINCLIKEREDAYLFL